MKRLKAQYSETASRRLQCGAETISALVTLVIFFFIVFTILDFAIAAYNKGAVVTASRVGARQGSLFWIDPAYYNRRNSVTNVRIAESMIRSGTEAYLALLMSNGSDAASPAYFVYGEGRYPSYSSTVTELTPDDIVCCLTSAGCSVTTCASRSDVLVDIGYQYSGFTAVPWIPQLQLGASAGTWVEADL
jgi:hypothetical protein